MADLRGHHLMTWEALLDDGSLVREREGARYRDIPRDRLRAFRLVVSGEPLLESFVPDGASGRNLVYRRRTTMQQGGTEGQTSFLVAWVPMGPAILVDPDAMTYRMEDGLIRGDPDMYPPVYLASEGEDVALLEPKGGSGVTLTVEKG